MYFVTMHFSITKCSNRRFCTAELCLAETAGDSNNECDPDPCQNGGECHDGQDAYTCQCTEGFTGDNCEEELPAVYLCHDDESADCDPNAICTHRMYASSTSAKFLRTCADRLPIVST